MNFLKNKITKTRRLKMFNKIKKDINLLRRQSAESSIRAFAMTYLMGHLKLAPSKAHLEVYDTLQEISNGRDASYVLAAPRDFGKSTMITLVYVLYCICYEKERFIVLASNTSKLSIRILDNVKAELLHNPLLREDFPELFEFKGKPRPPRWTKNEIETRTGIKVVAIGVTESSRGIRYKEYRPSLIICDDLEKGDAFSSTEAIEKVKDWFGKTMGMMGTSGTNYMVLGTNFHPFCLIGELLDQEKRPTWRKKVIAALVSEPTNTELWERWSNVLNGRSAYNDISGPEAAKALYDDNKEAMDKGAESVWPQKWTIYQLKHEQDTNPIVFSSERQNKPLDPKTQVFKADELQFWSSNYRSPEELIKTLENPVFFGACDPSTGKGDPSAIIILVRDSKDNLLYVIVADIRRRSVNDTINDIVDYARRYYFTKFVIETNVFQLLMAEQLRERCLKESITLNIEEVNNGSQSHKVERIQSLHSYTKPGIIQFNKNHRLLLEQLYTFPRGPHDDGPDALQMIVSHINTPPSGMGGVSSIKMNTPPSDSIKGVPDLRLQMFPHVYKRDDRKDRFVPDPEEW
jgi:predicted phage terminase large subunit-like protein